MRKLKLTPLFLLASVFGLSACTLPSWLSFLSFIPGLDAPEKEEKEEEKKKEEEEEEPKKTYTVDGVVADITDGVGVEFEETQAGSGVYFAGFYRASSTADAEQYPDNADEETLLTIAEWVLSISPEYLAADSYWFYDGIIEEGMSDEEKEEHDFWGDEDGSTALEAYAYTPDEKVFVEIISYCYQGFPCFGFYVADASLLS